MTQQINLLNPIFRPRWLVVSAARVALSLAGLLLLLIAVHAYQGDQVAHLQHELQSAQETLKAYQQSIDKMKKVATGVPQPALEAEIAKLQAQLKSQQENMAIVQSGAIGDRSGFSEYFRAFSRQAVEGLWLTGFSITGGKGDIMMRGRVTDAALVPDYIKRLNNEYVLKGRSFATLEMKRPTIAASGTGQPAARPAPYLEFRLAGSEHSEDARAPRKEERAP